MRPDQAQTLILVEAGLDADNIRHAILTSSDGRAGGGVVESFVHGAMRGGSEGGKPWAEIVRVCSPPSNPTLGYPGLCWERPL